MPRNQFDILIVGAGVLGVSIALELSRLDKNFTIGVIEKGEYLALGASGNNTGVIHRPFYLNPERKKTFARCALESYSIWKEFAAKHALPWSPVGTLEVATNEEDLKHLTNYLLWAKENGMANGEVELLNSSEVKKLEPHVKCVGALLCKTDVSVDFGIFTKCLAEEAKTNKVEFLLGKDIREVHFEEGVVSVALLSGEIIKSKFLINCAGVGALGVAQMCGLGDGFSTLRVRGEYWKVDDKFRNLTKHNVYSVPRNPNFPFLDPHWIIRHDGSIEIGPNAVPLFGADIFQGLINKLKLFGNPEFISLAIHEWRSSFSKNIMAGRVKKFLPDLKTEWLLNRGTVGVRSVLITREGTIAPEAIELQNENSFHILNYNSPGATGAPAFAKRVVEKVKNGIF